MTTVPGARRPSRKRPIAKTQKLGENALRKAINKEIIVAGFITLLRPYLENKKESITKDRKPSWF